MFTDLDAARVAHEACRALQHVLGDPCPAPPWDTASDEMKETVLQSVQGVRRGRTPRELHDDWVALKTAQGYTFAPTKDNIQKTHPCLIPYEDLPKTERIKDELFLAIVAVILSSG